MLITIFIDTKYVSQKELNWYKYHYDWSYMYTITRVSITATNNELNSLFPSANR